MHIRIYQYYAYNIELIVIVIHITSYVASCRVEFCKLNILLIICDLVNIVRIPAFYCLCK